MRQRKQRLEHCDQSVTTSRERLQPPDAERGRKDRPIECSEGSQPCRHLDPRPLGENSFLLFEAVVIDTPRGRREQGDRDKALICLTPQESRPHLRHAELTAWPKYPGHLLPEALTGQPKVVAPAGSLSGGFHLAASGGRGAGDGDCTEPAVIKEPR